jgi:hypothetical protein
MDLIPDPLLLWNSGSPGNQTRDLWICSNELWPLDHRGGQITGVKSYIVLFDKNNATCFDFTDTNPSLTLPVLIRIRILQQLVALLKVYILNLYIYVIFVKKNKN